MKALVPGYHFRVDFAVFGLFMSDTGFRKINGIGFEMNTSDVEVGGSATNKIQKLNSINFNDLVMERASERRSDLIKWLHQQCMSRRKSKIPIVVSLLDGYGMAMISWVFYNAYPVKWEISNIDSEGSGSGAILMDKITFKYEYYTQTGFADVSAAASVL
jgi:phage tail-like protein